VKVRGSLFSASIAGRVCDNAGIAYQKRAAQVGHSTGGGGTFCSPSVQL